METFCLCLSDLVNFVESADMIMGEVMYNHLSLIHLHIGALAQTPREVDGGVETGVMVGGILKVEIPLLVVA